MEVRRADKRDIPGLSRLLGQVLMVHHEGRPDLFKPDCKKYSEEDLEVILSLAAKEYDDINETPVFVAVEDGEVVGHAFCVKKVYKDDNINTDHKTLYIDDICIDENHRKLGVGKAIYEHVLAYAKEHGYYNITLNVWSCNPGAMKFYESMGLTPYCVGMEKIL